MIYMNVSKYLWSDAVLNACHLINWMLSSVFNDQVSFSCLYSNKSSFSMTRVLGSTCFVQDLSPYLDKLSLWFITCTCFGILELKKDTIATVLSIGSILCL